MAKDVAQMLPNMETRYTPVSDYLFNKLRETLREYIPRDEDYLANFDRFEYLLSLVHVDLTRKERGDGWWGPVGSFKWRDAYRSEFGVSDKIGQELEVEGANWAPLKAGLFGGSAEQAKIAKAKFDVFLSTINWY